VRADFGLEYIAYLVFAPLAGSLVPAWLLYEVTIANMSGVSEDRSTGVRIWYLVCTPALALTLLGAGVAAGSVAGFTITAAVLTAHVMFGVFLLAGEPLGPSRRVLVHWKRAGVGRFRRFMGPGIMQATQLQLLLGLGGLLLQLGAALLMAQQDGSASAHEEAERVVAFTGYAIAFMAFLMGLGAWLRARANSAAIPRVLLLAAIFLACVGPWIAMAITGVMTQGDDSSWVIAAPSPIYTFMMMDSVGKPSEGDVLTAGAACAAAWALFGVGLTAFAGVKTRKRLRQQARARARAESVLDKDDTRAATAAAAG
jgi:hypothetical protein